MSGLNNRTSNATFLVFRNAFRLFCCILSVVPIFSYALTFEEEGQAYINESRDGVATRMWVGTNGDWSFSKNWSDGNIADATNEQALFCHENGNIINVDTNISIGRLGVFGGSWIFSGKNTITLTTHGLKVAKAVASFSNNFSISSSGDYQFGIGDGSIATISGVISGSGNLIKTGAGTVIISNARNTYTGNTIIRNGTLQINANVDWSSGALGKSTNAVQLGDSGTGVSDNISLMFGASGLSFGRDIVVNNYNTSGTTTIGGNFSGGWAGSTFWGNITLNKSVNLEAASGYVDFEGIISGTGGVTKTGVGSVIFYGSNANTYTGDTIVQEGTLSLNKSAGVDAIAAGTLTIESGASVITYANEQINDSVNVVIDGGAMNIQRYDEKVNSLTMTGGTVSGTGKITAATVTTNASSTTSLISSDFGVTNTTFNVADGSADRDLEISGSISGTATVTKEGAGKMALTGSTANTYSGGTNVNEGTLELAKTEGVNAVGSGEITINSGATLLLGAANQIADAVNLTLAGGTFNTGGFNEVLGVLTLTANSIIDFASGSSILRFASIVGLDAFTLTIKNWTSDYNGGGTDQLHFKDTSGLTGNLKNLQFNGYSDTGIVNSTEVVGTGTPAPEGNTLFLGVIIGAIGFYYEIKRRKKLCII